MADELQAAVDSIHEGVLGLDDPKELAQTLLALTKLRSSLSAVIDDAHSRLASLMEKKEQDLGAGIGVVRRQRDVKTRWNHEGMLKLLMDQCRKVDLETGEVEINGFELAEAIKECVAFSYWRKTPLRGRKIDFEEFISEEYGQPRVRFLSKEGF